MKCISAASIHTHGWIVHSSSFPHIRTHYFIPSFTSRLRRYGGSEQQQCEDKKDTSRASERHDTSNYEYEMHTEKTRMERR